MSTAVIVKENTDMRENEILVLVQTNLFMHEKEFDLLRTFISNLDLTTVRILDEFAYNIELDEIEQIHPQDITNFGSICFKVQHGYALINLSDLKKLLSL